jgi:prepilin-type N-terminal cleavage/methylation domain-containing protein
MQYPNKRHGFTLVELLVVITIIGILIALLLPAVQAAREAARRGQCSNNLKQIGLAMQMHLEAKQVLPPGHFMPPDNGAPAQESTWVAYLLPYLEQQGLYETVDWQNTFGGAEVGINFQVCSTPLPMFICPSNDPYEAVFDGSSGVALGKKCYARGTYAANNGFGPMTEVFVEHLPLQRMGGVFYLNSKTTPADITDGLSNTAFAAEIRVVPGEDIRGTLHYPEGTLYHDNYTPNSTNFDQVRQGKCVSVPGAPCDDTQFVDWHDRAVIMTARSAHGGGVHVLLGDGGVRFVADSITLSVWQALSTPKGGEVPQDF